MVSADIQQSTGGAEERPGLLCGNEETYHSCWDKAASQGNHFTSIKIGRFGSSCKDGRPQLTPQAAGTGWARCPPERALL